MAVEISQPNGDLIADRDLYLNADKSQIVEEGEQARFVLAGKGGRIAPEYRGLPGLEKYLVSELEPEKSAEAKRIEELEAENTALKAMQSAPQNKAVTNAPNDKSEGEGEPTSLPDDFPGATELRAAGHATTEQVAALSDDDLIKVPGIGQATIAKIRERLAA